MFGQVAHEWYVAQEVGAESLGHDCAHTQGIAIA